MKITIFILLSVVFSIASAQDVLFTDDFEAGVPSEQWGLFWMDEDGVMAVESSAVPALLDNGGDYAGLIQDIDGTYTGAAMGVAGSETDQNYMIEADVYCYADNMMGSAYTGIVAYADSAANYYVKLVADFDSDHRFRLYNNILGDDWQYSFHHAIDATGLYDGDGWHRMGLEVETLEDLTVSYTAYFDGEYLAGPFIDDAEGHTTSGKYGIFSFQMSGTGIPGYFDNISVTAGSDILSGDLNNDGGVDVLDVVTMVDIILGGTVPDDYQSIAGDLNSDGTIDVLDVVAVVAIILDTSPSRSRSMTEASLDYGNGIINIQADSDIAGMELSVAGNFEITSDDLNTGWQLYSTNRKILLFNLTGEHSANSIRIQYDGQLRVDKAIVADWSGNGILPDTSTRNFSLNAAYPNPFNPATNITYTLSQPSTIRIEIFDVNGKKVDELFNNYQNAGTHQLIWNATGHSSGMYFLTLKGNGIQLKQKLLFIK